MLHHLRFWPALKHKSKIYFLLALLSFSTNPYLSQVSYKAVIHLLSYLLLDSLWALKGRQRKWSEYANMHFFLNICTCYDVKSVVLTVSMNMNKLNYYQLSGCCRKSWMRQIWCYKYYTSLHNRMCVCVQILDQFTTTVCSDYRGAPRFV